MKLEELELPFWFDRERPGASLEQLEQFEMDAGQTLPGELKEALLLRDGGVSNYSAFRRGDSHVPIPTLFSVEELRQAEARREVFGTPRGIIAIASGGHEWLGLDYRHGTVPKVVFQENEDSELEIVAESFEALLDGLVEE